MASCLIWLNVECLLLGRQQLRLGPDLSGSFFLAEELTLLSEGSGGH